MPLGRLTKKTSNTIFSGLPQEVVNIADRIGLEAASNSKLAADNCIRNQTKLKKDTLIIDGRNYLLEDRKNDFVLNQVQKRKQNKVKTNLTAKQRKQLFTIKKTDELKYETFVKVNKLWKEYMQSILNENFDLTKLIRCDYHGAMFIVCASRCPSLISLKGIVVQETRNTFKIIDKNNKILVIPKEGTIFAFKAMGKIFKLNGSYIKMSSHQRTRAKIKSKSVSNGINIV